MSVCVDLLGRLGNNFFQIACAVGYAEKHNVDYHIPPWEYSGYFNIKSKPGDVKVNYGEKGFCYEDIPFMEDVKLFGWFQSEKYFKHCEEKIRELFRFNDAVRDKMYAKYADALILGTTASVHVRRGDYIGNNFHEVCHLPYYLDAIQEMKNRTNIDLFLVFSDDHAWCRENLKGENYLFAENNSNIEDLFLQTQCAHNIICNSSFSWWGAWLNPNKDKIVISPDKWFGDASWDIKDLIPENWIKIKIK